MSDDCLFCKITRGEVPADIVYEDEQVVVFKDINPQAKVHWLVVPRLHLVSLKDFEEKHDALSAYMLRLLPKLAEQAGLTDGFRTIINTGVGGGQVVDHLHIHLLGGLDGDRLPGF